MPTRSLLSALTRRETLLHSSPAGLSSHESLLARLSVTHTLSPHDGCVNTVAWSADATLLLTGSDDLSVKIHDAATLRVRGCLQTGHSHNVFDARFVPCSNNERIATTAADGQVRLLNVERNQRTSTLSGSSACLFSGHASGMGLRLCFATPTTFLTTHGDGRIRFFDLRVPSASVLVDFSTAGAGSDLSFDLGRPPLFGYGSEDIFTRLMDLRKPSEPVALIAPPHLAKAVRSRRVAFLRDIDGVSGLAWRGFTHELVVTYRGEECYRFDTRDLSNATPLRMKYDGRANEKTFLKNVVFFADNAYVATGGDDGFLYVWHADTGKLIVKIHVDDQILNAIASHPHGLPILCVSGSAFCRASRERELKSLYSLSYSRLTHALAVDDDAKLVEPGELHSVMMEEG